MDMLTALCNGLFSFHLLEKRSLLICFFLLLLHLYHGHFVRVDIDLSCKSIYNRASSMIRLVNLNIRCHQRWNVHRTRQNRCMGIGRALLGDNRQKFTLIKLYGLTWRQILSHNNDRLWHRLRANLCTI